MILIVCFHFELISCAWCEVRVEVHCVLCRYLIFPALFAEKTILCPFPHFPMSKADHMHGSVSRLSVLFL
jgi:hypothetical protein